MLVLLPPSETKRPGGEGAPLDLDRLAFPTLREPREAVVDALVALSADEDAAARVLKLSARRRHEIADNAALRTGPTMAAVDRYTGVLYDALDAASLDGEARAWLGAHVAIQSAPLGPVGALDRIPTYRLAAGTSLPGVASLRRVWADAVRAAVAARTPDFVLDLRSEAYVALGPLPSTVASAYIRVVTPTPGGAARALNHFNKHAKGAFVRSLARHRPSIGDVDDLRASAESMGWTIVDGVDGEVALVVRG
ncbi:peroxide stress protein YaaA [Microbacterium sp. lyk4-40-TSB-66]|uniref:YaaA family protein n=1 Tax=Microbacterium sp. lyk4-40-TSB-66 TaxID=3040294 RepID=UPI00254F950E|nr:peroxide stress protein YaaA [Microbacterium sp. lyk4-40-TSB-66]